MRKPEWAVDILKQISRHYDEDRYEQLSDLVRIYALVDTLVRAEELCSITIDEYDRRTGTVRINSPKGATVGRCSSRATPSGSSTATSTRARRGRSSGGTASCPTTRSSPRSTTPS